MMSPITTRPAFWTAFALVSLVCAGLAWRYFPQALPLINLDVKMSREEALERAGSIAQHLRLSEPDAQRAVVFSHDGSTQNYVELEGGGKSAFARLMSGEVYSPFHWDVRLFKPGETAEARVRFKPDGSVYGFNRQVPENAPGPALEAEAARAIAEAAARADWGVDLGPYARFDQSHVQRPSGRVDHTFVYERKDVALGEARLRLQLTVSGDALTEVTYFVHVPEAFERRFAELRSANNTIAGVASLAAGALYGLGGCIIGVVWLMRRRYLLWKQSLLAGAVVAGLNAAAILASAPEAWFGYDTAQSTTVFWGQQIGVAALVLVGGGLALALVFMAAEGLSRKAFPRHPQLWSLWSRAAAPTPAVLGRTLGGYLFVPVELSLIAGFYLVTNTYFGWWQPSESLSDPNILGSAVPALAPIGQALQAGFLEECLFRAVPLSLAALIGARFGLQRPMIVAALLLEALVFAAAHANYPGFPSYSRLVELFVPALIWGLIFLRFGLLPTVILHALFDLTLMSLPVFLVQGPGANLNRALVVAAALVPLGVVLWRRAEAGRWLALPAPLLNGSWRPGAAAAARAHDGKRATAGVWTDRVQRVLPLLALAGLASFAFVADFHGDAPPVQISRDRAQALADQALAERGIVLGPEWKQFAVIRQAAEDGTAWSWNKFVWREAGPEAYRKLVGSWLAPPLWAVRYARFSGVDVADRAEEWQVAIQGDGKVRQIQHQLPENRSGARLTEEQARKLAQREITAHLGLDPGALREVEVNQDPRPARTDWEFKYGDAKIDVGTGGEARAVIDLAGDEVVGLGRYIFVPESWYRSERDRASRLGVLRIAVGLCFVLLAIAALIGATLAWTRDHFDRRAFVWAGLLLLGSSILAAANRWPLLAIGLKTTEPVLTQVALSAGGMLFGAVLTALIGAMFIGVGALTARIHIVAGLDERALWLRGAALALVAMGANAALAALSPETVPLWSKYDVENAWLPVLSQVLGATKILPVIGVAVVALDWLNRITAGWTRHRLLAVLLMMLTNAAVAAISAEQWFEIAAAGPIMGALAALLFATVLRFDLRAVPPLVAVYASLMIVAQALQKGTPQAAYLGAVGVAATLAIGWAATRYLVAAGVAAEPSPIAAEIPSAAANPAPE